MTSPSHKKTRPPVARAGEAFIARNRVLRIQHTLYSFGTAGTEEVADRLGNARDVPLGIPLKIEDTSESIDIGG